MSSPSNSDRLCSDFAGQLEHLGLWDWAVFVLLHIQVIVSVIVQIELPGNILIAGGLNHLPYIYYQFQYPWQ